MQRSVDGNSIMWILFSIYSTLWKFVFGSWCIILTLRHKVTKAPRNTKLFFSSCIFVSSMIKERHGRPIIVSWRLSGKKTTMSQGNYETPNMERSRSGSACLERSRRKESPRAVGDCVGGRAPPYSKRRSQWQVKVSFLLNIARRRCGVTRKKPRRTAYRHGLW